MKKRSTKTSANKKTRGFSLKSIIAFFRDERFKVSLGVFLLAFAIILCLSFTSYFFTWKSDQSILDVEFTKLLGKNSYQVENWIGKVGAVLSNKFIHDGFGGASFSFVAILAVIWCT